MLQEIVRKSRTALLPILALGIINSPVIAQDRFQDRHFSISAGYSIPTEDIGKVYPAGIQYGAGFSQRSGPFTFEGEFDRFQSTAELRKDGSTYIFGSSQEEFSREVIINRLGLNVLVNTNNMGIGGGVIAENVQLDENYCAAERGLLGNVYTIQRKLKTIPFVGGKAVLEAIVYDGGTSNLSLRATAQQTKPLRPKDAFDLRKNGAYTLSLRYNIGIQTQRKRR
jgi:hypothetical protein